MMAEWLKQVCQRYEMYYHDLEVMSSNPGQVELGVLVLLSKLYLIQKYFMHGEIHVH